MADKIEKHVESIFPEPKREDFYSMFHRVVCKKEQGYFKHRQKEDYIHGSVKNKLRAEVKR